MNTTEYKDPQNIHTEQKSMNTFIFLSLFSEFD